MKQAKVVAIIVAAGNSVRMGQSKPFIPINGKPMIAYTLQTFETCSCVDEIVLVVRDGDSERMQRLVQEYAVSKVTAIVVGGDTRQRSVENGLVVCSEDTAYVAIHDGDRPMITCDTIERVVQATVQYGAAAAAVHTKDTIKIADEEGMIVSTPNRAYLWNIQTPQMFSREVYERACAHARKSGLQVTDDCQLVEAIGHPIKLIESSYANIKITTPEDLPLAEELLK